MSYIYKENGYESRDEYIECLALEYGVDVQTVFIMAVLLGPNEDFDGLVVAIQDYADD